MVRVDSAFLYRWAAVASFGAYIRGLASGAHMMVMCADMKDDGTWILQGSDADFDELLNDLNDEIDAGLAPKKNLPALRRIRDSVTPQDDDGL